MVFCLIPRQRLLIATFACDIEIEYHLNKLNSRLSKTIMMDVIKQITAKNKRLGDGLLFAVTHMEKDPAIALSKSRSLLESILNNVKQAEGNGLHERIGSLNGQISDTIVTQMHFIRKMGNIGVHAASDANKQSCAQCVICLISVSCWFYGIDNPELTFTLVEPKLATGPSTAVSQPVGLKARYFIADGIFKTWPKIAVLTSDGVLYSQYLHFMRLKIFKREGIDFESFNASDFSFGADEHGHNYQPIREVTREQAKSYRLTQQGNWLEGYLSKIGIR